METHLLRIELPDGTIAECPAKIATDEPWRIELECEPSRRFEAEADDLFEALISIRLQLAQEGMKILCNGARENIVCSGMSRDMGGGRKAYVVTLGRQATMDSLVDIFDYADSSQIVSVATQQAFTNQWFESLRV